MGAHRTFDALLSPTRHVFDHPTLADEWVGVLPTVAALVREADPKDMVGDESSGIDAVEHRWGDLAECFDEVARLAADDGS